MDVTQGSVQQKQQDLVEAHERCIARIVVDHWKAVARHRLAAVQLRNAQTANFLARVHWRTVLLRKVLAAWRRFGAEHREAQQRHREQRRLRGHQLLVHAAAARQFFLLRAFLFLWRCRLKERLHGRSISAQATQHHTQRLLRRVVTAWRQRAEWHARRRNEEAEAAAQLLMTCQRHLFHRWRRRLAYFQELQHASEMLQHRYELLCLRLAFEQWRCGRQWVRYLHWAEGRAREHAALQLQCRAFCAWRTVVLQRQQRTIQDCGRVEQFRFDADRRLRRRVFRRWLQCTFYLRAEQLRLERAHQHHRRRVLSWCLLRLLRYMECRRRKLLLRVAADTQCAYALKKSALSRWRTCHARRIVLYRRLEAALQWRQRYNLRRVMGAWRRYTLQRWRKKEEEGEVRHARDVRLLRSGVSKWLEIGLAMRAKRVFSAAERDAETAYRRHHALQTLVRRWRRNRLHESTADRMPCVPSAGCTPSTPLPVRNQRNAAAAPVCWPSGATSNERVPPKKWDFDRRPPAHAGLERGPSSASALLPEPPPLTPIPAALPTNRPPPRRPALLQRGGGDRHVSRSDMQVTSNCTCALDDVVSPLVEGISRPSHPASSFPATGSQALAQPPGTTVPASMNAIDVAALLQELHRVQGALQCVAGEHTQRPSSSAEK